MSEKESFLKSMFHKERFVIVNYVLLLITAACMAALNYLIFKNKLLEFKHMKWIVLGVSALLLIVSLLFILKKRLLRLNCIWLVILIIGSAFALSRINSALSFVKKINVNASYDEFQMNVAVPADSPLNDVKDIPEIGAPLTVDKESVEKVKEEIVRDYNPDMKFTDCQSYVEGYNQLMEGKFPSLLINGAYIELIKQQHKDFDQKVRIIKTFTIRQEKKAEEIKKEEAPKPVADEAFNVYFSGIDTYGSVSAVSRSDVNVILTINPKTHKILMTTTPRDAYVQIPDGGNNGWDKLTHAGIYGVEASMHTLENLYDTKIPYYARLNFSSFLKVIDAIGGIDVYNDQDFVSLHGKFHFPVGEIHMDSQMALGFVRERYSLRGGDHDRGKNHEKVLTAIIKKMTQPANLANFPNILSSLEDTVQTNMPIETIMNLVNAQLDSGKPYEISSVALTGHGSTGKLPSYAMPGYKLYMMEVDQDSLNTIKAQIKDVLDGK